MAVKKVESKKAEVQKPEVKKVEPQKAVVQAEPAQPEPEKIAILYKKPIPRTVSIPARPKPHEYSFVVRFGVSLAYVNAEDVDKILALKEYCCGGQANSAFVRASPSAIHVWNTGRY